MIIASDVHGNLERLKAFVEQINGVNPKEVYILGDLIDWGCSPEDDECVNIVKSKGFNVLKGNHEDWSLNIPAIRQHYKLDEFLSDENIRYLTELPEEMFNGECIFRHVMPPVSSIGIMKRTRNIQDAKEAFEYLATNPKIKIGFLGHYHNPVCFFYDERVPRYGNELRRAFSLTDKRIYLINPGSIGQSKKGNYVIFDKDKRTLERKELE